MSIPVELASLAEAIARYRFAYLMTNRDQGAPHVVQVSAVLQGGELCINCVGKRTRANALARPDVSLVWPPQIETDYSLIVDGRAVMKGESLNITPTRAVLHRASSSPAADMPGQCGSDCVEINLTPEPAPLR